METDSQIIQYVLFIDDDPDHLSLLQQRVELALKVVVDCVSTSAGAERLLNERRYDLVISDVSLRGELGTRVLQRLREQDPTQPVLLLTSYDRRDAVMRDAVELNLPIFSKIDVVQPEFIDLLRTLLSRRPRAEQSEPAPDNLDSVRDDSEPNTRQRSGPKRRIFLTSPLVAAARAARFA